MILMWLLSALASSCTVMRPPTKPVGGFFVPSPFSPNMQALCAHAIALAMPGCDHVGLFLPDGVLNRETGSTFAENIRLCRFSPLSFLSSG